MFPLFILTRWGISKTADEAKAAGVAKAAGEEKTKAEKEKLDESQLRKLAAAQQAIQQGGNRYCTRKACLLKCMSA
jgi:hypothetical protein